MARWIGVQCIVCGQTKEGNPTMLQMSWEHKGCPGCHTKLGYRVLEHSPWDRQRTYYRDPETNELHPGDLCYKIPPNLRKKGQNISFKADLKNESLLRRPTRSRQRKILGMKPKKVLEDEENERRKRRQLKSDIHSRRAGLRV